MSIGINLANSDTVSMLLKIKLNNEIHYICMHLICRTNIARTYFSSKK